MPHWRHSTPPEPTTSVCGVGELRRPSEPNHTTTPPRGHHDDKPVFERNTRDEEPRCGMPTRAFLQREMNEYMHNATCLVPRHTSGKTSITWYGLAWASIGWHRVFRQGEPSVLYNREQTGNNNTPRGPNVLSTRRRKSTNYEIPSDVFNLVFTIQ